MSKRIEYYRGNYSGRLYTLDLVGKTYSILEKNGLAVTGLPINKIMHCCHHDKTGYTKLTKNEAFQYKISLTL